MRQSILITNTGRRALWWHYSSIHFISKVFIQAWSSAAVDGTYIAIKSFDKSSVLLHVYYSSLVFCYCSKLVKCLNRLSIIMLSKQICGNIYHESYTANVYRGLRIKFSLQYLWKRAVRIIIKPYTHRRERLCMLWGNPVIFTDSGQIL